MEPERGIDQKLRTKRAQGLGQEQEGHGEADLKCLHCSLESDKVALRWHMSSGEGQTVTGRLGLQTQSLNSGRASINSQRLVYEGRGPGEGPSSG